MNSKRHFAFVASTVAVLCGTSLPSQAVTLTWDSAPRAILKIYPHDTGVSITLDGTVNANSACPSRLMIALNSPNYSAKIATLMTAYAQGKRIVVNFDADHTACDTPVNRLETEN